MKDYDYWKKLGFRFEQRFPGEYDLWFNPTTFQYLRRYFTDVDRDGQEWLQNTTTGEYELVK